MPRQVLVTVVFVSSMWPLNASGQAPTPAPPPLPTHANVVYGMAWGASLLMDVYVASQPNGMGVVLISGSGFGVYGPYQRGYESSPLKIDWRAPYVGDLGRGLLGRGYTIFMIDHRFAPGVRYDEIIGDARRAVRFIRANAATYGVNPNRLGAAGHSSGGYLAAMLGLHDVVEPNPRNTKVDAQSSRAHAVVTLAAPFDMTEFNFEDAVSARATSNLLGGPPDRGPAGEPLLTGAYWDGSPITYLTPDDSPMLMYHALDDPVIPKDGATKMAAAAAADGLTHRLVMRETGKHVPAFDLDEVDRWFRQHLGTR